MSKDNYPTAPLQSTGAIAEAIEKQKQDALKPVQGVKAEPIPKLWVDVDLSDIRRSIEYARTVDDFFAVVVNKEKTTLHLITGDIKSMGFWTIIRLIGNIFLKFIKPI
jgi:hypothetical protein